MSSEIIFIYDGECPFCNHFAHLLELKSSLPNLKILDGRKNLSKLTSLFKEGYDLNSGAILIRESEILHGSNAINFICSQMKEPNDALLEILRVIFASSKRSKYIFPVLLVARRLLLSIKGSKWQPVNEDTNITSNLYTSNSKSIFSKANSK